MDRARGKLGEVTWKTDAIRRHQDLINDSF